tara:strand:- start:13 stop:309 length:297 start_codon:yes stop_codon:yes gene_type:complete
MAKTKKKKEDIIDLKPEKITDEQLTKVQDQVNRINKFQLEVGMLESRKHALLHQVGAVQNEISETQVELEKQYGTADINVQDGTINYTKENGEADKKD